MSICTSFKKSFICVRTCSKLKITVGFFFLVNSIHVDVDRHNRSCCPYVYVRTTYYKINITKKTKKTSSIGTLP